MANLLKKAVAAVISASMALTAIPYEVFAVTDNFEPQAQETAAENVYTADFSKLVTDGANTTYGTSDDVIKLDDYTTAYLTYAGTYVSSDAVVYLMGGNNGKGALSKCSYIEFTAPSSGTVKVVAAAYNYYLNGTYTGYSKSENTLTLSLTEGQKLQIGQRISGTYVKSLTFTPTAEATPVPDPTAVPTDVVYYESPSTTWDFSSSVLSEGNNTPILGGNAELSDGEIKFPSGDTATGSLTLNMTDAIKKDIQIEFDAIGHSSALGQQIFHFIMANSEETIIDLQAHPYSDDAGKGLQICGETVADNAAVRKAWTAVGTTHVKAVIDYTALTVTVTVGSTEFTGTIPEGIVPDLKTLTLSSTRSKTAGDRYISVDNLTVSEFNSTSEPATPTVTEGYTEETISGYPCRIKKAESNTAVIYLASELRSGTDGYSQLYDAKSIFDKLSGSATLIAPQTETAFSDVSALVNEIKSKYGVSTVTVIGQSKSAAAALASGADKIITIAGSGTAVPSGKVWVFGGYADTVTPISDIKTTVNTLQNAGTDTRYTEYPFAEHKLNSLVAEEDGLSDWILKDSSDSKVVDLVLFSGQSNMAGRGTYSESTTVPAGQGYEYHSVTSPATLSSVQEPFGKYENNTAINDNSGAGSDRRSGDMVAALMKAYYAKTGVPIVGVQASRGGQATTYFMDSTVMNEMQNRFNNAEAYLKSAGYTVRKKALVWCQGEADADANRSDDSYKSNTLSIFNSLKSACGITDMFIVRTGHYNINYGLSDGASPSEDALTKDERYLRISNAQQALADENDNIYAVASLYSDYCLANMRDQYHYYQPVYNTIGETAGSAIGDIYTTGTVTTPSPAASAEPVTSESPKPSPSAVPTDKPGYDLSWDFSTDQTAASGNNVPVISGNAVYDEANQNIKLTAAKSSDNSVTVNLSPAAEGVLTGEFDANISSLSNAFLNITANDSTNTSPLSFTLNTYTGTADVKIGGILVAEAQGVGSYFNKVAGDGMKAAKTHFKVEINTLKHTASINMAKPDTDGITFSGSISSDVSDVQTLKIARSSSNSNGDRHIYVDNISIKSYVPTASIYATGAASVTKKMGSTVTSTYEISKTYADDTETYEWSVSGVEGVTIDSATGVLSVPETASSGTVSVTVKLTKSSTLPVGTSDTMYVEIKDFPSMASYTVGGSFTLVPNGTTAITLDSVIDADGNDITDFAEISGFKSSAPTVAELTADGKVTAKSSGTTDVSFTLSIPKLGVSETVTRTIKVSAYELTSSASSIDISSLASYGASTYRLYLADGSYTTVSASGNTVANATGKEITVVPVYKFNYSSTDTDGYVTATGTYSPSVGYGLESGINYNINENGALPVSGRPLKADLPDGHYDITVTRRGGVRADVYSNGHQIINNTTSSGSQNRPSGSGVMDAPRMKVEGGNLNLTIGNYSGSNERIQYVEIAKVPEKLLKSTVWVAGDSESANYYPIDSDGSDLDSNKLMMTGFGMQLKYFLSDKYNIADFGQPSATTETWANECLASVQYQLEKDDTVIMCFGINDAVNSTHSVSVAVMKEQMRRVYDAVTAAGAKLIIVSPVYNTKYQSKTYFTYNPTSDANAGADFAAELGVPFIDMNKFTQLYVNRAAEETGDTSWVYNNYHVGDKLHLTQHGALLAASFIAGGMDALGYETTDFSYTYNDIASVDTTSYTKGDATGVTREYSVASAKKFMGLDTPDTKDWLTVDKEGNVTVNLSSAPKTAVLVKASYTNGALSVLKSYSLEFKDNTASTKTDAPQNNDKFFVWDSLDTMIPLLNATTIFVSDATPAPEATSSPSIAPTASPTASPTANPTSAPTAVPTEEPYTVLYSQDFENYSIGDTGGWTSPAGKMAIQSDTENNLGKYQTVVSGKSGTCRTGYVELPSAVTQNFVFECDYRSTSNVNVSDLELLEDRYAFYSNHGVYSNKNFVLTMARPSGSNLYVINNKLDDSGLKIDRYEAPVFKTAEIQNNPWLHIKAVGDFDNQRIILYVTSLDGKTEYYHGMHDMNVGREGKITSWKLIHMLSPSSGAYTCIDNILVRTAVNADFAPNYHSVTLTCASDSFDQYVLDGDKVVNIPDVSAFGDYFKGWQVGDKLLTSEELAAYPITSDCTISGVISDDYIEPLSTVEFNSFPAANSLVMGEDENTYGDNEISLTITGEQGTSLITNPDTRVTDYKIDWEFDGFRLLDGKATGDTGNVYCDSYGLVEITKEAQSSVNFRLKKTSANYYGMVTAKVTYNGKTLSVSRPLVLLGDKTADESVIMPEPGYTSDYSKYDAALSGYTLTAGKDPLFGKWSAEGSDGSHYEFIKDSDSGYLRYIRNGSGNSAYGYYAIGNLSSETVFEQDVRFSYNGSISYTGGEPTSIKSTAFSLTFNGSALTFNNTELCTASKNTWYHIVINMDPTSKTTFAKAYDMSGKLLGETEIMNLSDSAYSGGQYYRILPSKATNAAIDLNNVTIREAEVDTITVKANETANIPSSGTTEITLSASALTSDGTAALGLAQWTIDDELAEGVTIASSGNQTAVLTITSEAASGDLPIRCTINGKSQTITVKLLGDKDNVAFTAAPTGLEIGSGNSCRFTAEVRNGQAETVTGRNITYALYDADNKTSVSPDGVSISSDGLLTVTSAAKPQTIGVRASSVDSDGKEISKFVKITLYNLNFNFGNTASAEASTPVTASVLYTDSRGYGLEGTAADSDSGISGSGVTFKLKLEKGNVYEVTAKFKGTITCERISSKLSGFTKASTALTENTYKVAVFGDDIMDITLSSDTTLASLTVTRVERAKAAKPQWFTIGDSTVQQNGSWGYTIASASTTDLSKYPELAAVCSAFYNSGKAGEKHTDYYANGRLNSILTAMNIGDVVSLSGMGTNDSSSTQAQFKEYDKAYVDAIIDMGGYVILGSYTPTGNYGATQGKVYDADTMTFKGMRTYAYDLAIRELYSDYADNSSVLGFLDIGKFSDEMMTADVRAVYADAIAAGDSEAAAREKANARATEMMAWWKDFNHYYTDFSSYILPTLTSRVAELIDTVY